jgi:hypothetical protein
MFWLSVFLRFDFRRFEVGARPDEDDANGNSFDDDDDGCDDDDGLETNV